MDLDFSQVTYHQIDEDNHQQRIDNFMMTLLKGVPKSVIYRIIRKGEVRVNKKRIDPSYKLQVNDQLRIPPIRVATPTEKPAIEQILNTSNIQSLEREIIYEDEYLIALNKYSGIAVHGGSGVSFGVIEALRKLRPNHKFLELVHRIDRDTSGLLLVAKKRSSLIKLQEQLRHKQMRKSYLALVLGNWSRTKVNLPLLRVTAGTERIVRVSSQGKESITNFEKLESFAEFASLIKAQPITGRTHQIRVHCLSQGHAIAGDIKYAAEDLELWKEYGLHRLFLHAHHLEFIHPHSEERMSLTAPLSNELEAVLSKLRNIYNS